jgi:alpha-amylase
MRKFAFLIALVFALAPATAQAAPAKIDGSSVGVQLFMWNWNSVAKECTTHLGPAGYDWVLVMPPQEHIDGAQWWVHYQPVSYKIESRLGTRIEFESMVKACNDAGVKVIADAVINHMMGSATADGWTGGEFTKYTHPGLYAPEDFHSAKQGISDWNDIDQVQNNELVGLSDLATEKPNVRQSIATYLNDLLSLGVYGFRIDAARHIPAADLVAIKALLPANTYFLQEVASKLTPDIADYYPTGDVWEFDWVSLMNTSFIEAGAAQYLPSQIEDSSLQPSQSVVTMVTNHDTERNGSAITSDDAAKQQLAFIYTLASRYGKPMIYSGYSFSDYDAAPKLSSSRKVANASCPSGSAAPKSSYKNSQFTCQHRWKAVESMIAWRDYVGSAKETGVKGGKGVLSFGRGDLGHLVINSNTKTSAVKIKTQLAAGKYCDLLTGGRNANILPRKCLGSTVVVDRYGYLSASMPKQTAVAITKASKQR